MSLSGIGISNFRQLESHPPAIKNTFMLAPMWRLLPSFRMMRKRHKNLANRENKGLKMFWSAGRPDEARDGSAVEAARVVAADVYLSSLLVARVGHPAPRL